MKRIIILSLTIFAICATQAQAIGAAVTAVVAATGVQTATTATDDDGD